MTLWLDEQLSPALCPFISESSEVECRSVYELGLDRLTDLEIFTAAREARAVLVSKDSDFVDLVERFGSPPKLIWITCGNRSNLAMKEILLRSLAQAIELLQGGEDVVEVA